MNSWKSRCDELARLIKIISDHYGGDDPEFLADYVADIAASHGDAIQDAIDWGNREIATLGLSPLKMASPSRTIDFCKTCGYRAPFCYFEKHERCTHNDEDKAMRG